MCSQQVEHLEYRNDCKVQIEVDSGDHSNEYGVLMAHPVKRHLQPPKYFWGGFVWFSG